MESNNSINNNKIDENIEENTSFWQILENQENIENVEVLHQNPEHYRRHGAVAESDTEVLLALTNGAGGEGDEITDEPVMVNGLDDEEMEVGYLNDGGWELGMGGVPDVMVDQLPMNQIAHNGGGDAELMFDPQLVIQELSQQLSEMIQNSDTDQMEFASNTTSTIDDIGYAAAMTFMEQCLIQCVEKSDIQEGNVIQILELCDFIQEQLLIIGDRISSYEKRLNQYYNSLSVLCFVSTLLLPETVQPEDDAV